MGGNPVPLASYYHPTCLWARHSNKWLPSVLRCRIARQGPAIGRAGRLRGPSGVARERPSLAGIKPRTVPTPRRVTPCRGDVGEGPLVLWLHTQRRPRSGLAGFLLGVARLQACPRLGFLLRDENRVNQIKSACAERRNFTRDEHITHQNGMGQTQNML